MRGKPARRLLLACADPLRRLAGPLPAQPRSCRKYVGAGSPEEILVRTPGCFQAAVHAQPHMHRVQYDACSTCCMKEWNEPTQRSISEQAQQTTTNTLTLSSSLIRAISSGVHFFKAPQNATMYRRIKPSSISCKISRNCFPSERRSRSSSDKTSASLTVVALPASASAPAPSLSPQDRSGTSGENGRV